MPLNEVHTCLAHLLSAHLQIVHVLLNIPLVSSRSQRNQKMRPL